ncbi:hypothetical protein [Sphingobacterium suaedae]|uniref:Molecular chaperone n=1 Tax=Sphingobacterium suaedae TaxID=1686402 RepID=A0ABW5KMC2_9SPHI
MKYLFALFFLYSTVTLVFGQGISVSPSRVFFKGEAGQTVSQAITFQNGSNGTLDFVAQFKDWDRDSLGVKRYYPTGGGRHSNAEWLSLSESTLRLAPGESKSVVLSMTIPLANHAPLLTNSMLFFTQANEQSKMIRQGVAVNVLLEVGIQVYHVPSGLTAGDLEFLAFEDRGRIEQAGRVVRRMAVKVKNTGQINKDAYVRFELTSIESGAEIPVKAVAVAMLPEAEQWIQLDLPADLTGRYLAVAILDAGRQYDLKVAEKEITY